MLEQHSLISTAMTYGHSAMVLMGIALASGGCTMNVLHRVTAARHDTGVQNMYLYLCMGHAQTYCVNVMRFCVLYVLDITAGDGCSCCIECLCFLLFAMHQMHL
jgi:hypothetical protein